MKAIIGRKRGMTQIYAEGGRVLPVTVIEAGPCPVVQVKTVERDGYNALQIGFDEMKPTRVNKPMTGHFQRAGITPRRRLQEVRMEDVSEFTPGSELRADVFAVGDIVDVQGVSKGKGFQGGMKRYGFSGGKGSHGAKNHRELGSIGQCATPAKVWKGHRMAGHTGARTITVRNLEVVQVDAERNLLVLRGAVPGPCNEFVTIKKR